MNALERNLINIWTNTNNRPHTIQELCEKTMRRPGAVHGAIRSLRNNPATGARPIYVPGVGHKLKGNAGETARWEARFGKRTVSGVTTMRAVDSKTREALPEYGSEIRRVTYPKPLELES